MTFQGAFIAAHNLSFMVVLVNKSIIDDRARAEQTIQFFQSRLASTPTVLMARDYYGTPSAYYGRRDIALILARMPPETLEWKEFSIA
jgi:hypothetical protein